MGREEGEGRLFPYIGEIMENKDILSGFGRKVEGGQIQCSLLT